MPYLTRRDFVRLSATASAASAAPPPGRPNILLIVSDQFRFDWIGARGAQFVKTPNIDTLASNGLMFTRAVCNSPVCAPSRVSLASGVYANRVGGYENGSAYYPARANGFSELRPSFYNVLAANGYRGAMAGKCDLAKGSASPKRSDGQKGSILTNDSHSGYPLTRELGIADSWVIPKFSGGYLKQLFGRSDLQELYARDEEARTEREPAELPPSPFSDEFYYEHLLGRKALEILDTLHSTPEKPWFFHLNFHAPHPPHDAPREYLERYRGASFPSPASGDMSMKASEYRGKGGKKSGEARLHSIQQHYAAMITMVDEWIGKVIARLKKNGQYENTVILFASDHGEMLGDFGLFNKTYMYEGSVRVPLIVSGPGVTARGRSTALAELVDLYPTILDLAGCSYDRDKLDGLSLAPILGGRSREHKSHQYSEWGGVAAAPYARRRMVFDGRYKLIDTLGFLELYDLEADPRESTNVAQRNAVLVAKLQKVMNGYGEKALPPLRLGKGAA